MRLETPTLPRKLTLPAVFVIVEWRAKDSLVKRPRIIGHFLQRLTRDQIGTTASSAKNVQILISFFFCWTEILNLERKLRIAFRNSSVHRPSEKAVSLVVRSRLGGFASNSKGCCTSKSA